MAPSLCCRSFPAVGLGTDFIKLLHTGVRGCSLLYFGDNLVVSTK